MVGWRAGGGRALEPPMKAKMSTLPVAMMGGTADKEGGGAEPGRRAGGWVGGGSKGWEKSPGEKEAGLCALHPICAQGGATTTVDNP